MAHLIKFTSGRAGRIVRPVSVASGIALLLLLPAGCTRKPTPAWGTASGQVLRDGKPVTDGIVIFENAELGVARTAPLDATGHFVQQSVGFAGLPVGKYAVSIRPQKSWDGGFVAAKPRTGASEPTDIPERYRNPQTSGLSFDVQAGQNPTAEFQLEP